MLKCSAMPAMRGTTTTIAEKMSINIPMISRKMLEGDEEGA